MPHIRFTENIQRHTPCPNEPVSGETLAEALANYFLTHPAARGYVLDDQGALRPHMVIFIDGRHLRDRTTLSDPLPPNAVIDIMQALSGG